MRTTNPHPHLWLQWKPHPTLLTRVHPCGVSEDLVPAALPASAISPSLLDLYPITWAQICLITHLRENAPLTLSSSCGCCFFPPPHSHSIWLQSALCPHHYINWLLSIGSGHITSDLHLSEAKVQLSRLIDSVCHGI